MKQSNNKKVVFFGSSKYSVIDEEAVHDAFGLSLVVTLPDQIDKKTKQSLPNTVKKFAQDNNIPVITADKLTPEVYLQIEKYQPDFLVSADIRLIIPNQLLKLPKIAAINVHQSLLPKFRGPAPVPFTILSGDQITGVSIILIAEKVDTGDILAQEKYEMTKDDTTDSVLTQLNQLGSQLAVKVIQNFDEYYKNRKVQDESQVTYSQYMKREDGFIDLSKIDSMSALEIRNLKLEIARKVRAYFPWPGVWTIASIKNKALRIKLLPGKMIQIEGKKPITYNDFIHGYPEGEDILKQLYLIPRNS